MILCFESWLLFEKTKTLKNHIDKTVGTELIWYLEHALGNVVDKKKSIQLLYERM